MSDCPVIFRNYQEASFKHVQSLPTSGPLGCLLVTEGSEMKTALHCLPDFLFGCDGIKGKGEMYLSTVTTTELKTGFNII